MPTSATTRGTRMELWGGVEPTLNRVADRYFSQLERSGHHERLSDLERCADLGLRTLRYPVLWEHTMPDGGDEPNWRWADERLARLADLGISSIVGLVHHGSGPRDTSLLDPQFPTKLARYASRVAAEAGRELGRAARFKAGFFRPAFINVLMRALQQSAGVRAVMADLIAGQQGYADLKWRLLKTFEIGLAWRALTSSSSRPAL